MRRSKVLSAGGFHRWMGLESRAEKVWFWVTFCLLAAYVEAVVYMQTTTFGGAPTAGASVAWAVGVVPLCAAGVMLCRKARLRVDRQRTDRKKAAVLFVAVAAVSFLWLFLWQRAYWPGGFSPDCRDQLKEAVTGSYDNWHPVLHTWLFFTVPYKLFRSFAAIVTTQIALYSLALAYLALTLYRCGCPKLLLLAGMACLIADPAAAAIMMYPWKDCALDIFSLVLYTQLVRIYFTDGAWLKKWYNVLAVSVIAFLANGMRHNSVLLIGPLFLFLIIFFRNARRELIVSAAAVLAAALLFQGPVMSLAQVEQPDQRVVETMGLPMTVISDVYRYDPDALSEEAQTFFSDLLTPFEWEFYHRPGGFNSIKWANNDVVLKVDALGTATILRYFGEAVRNSPQHAADSAIRLTSILWGLRDGTALTVPLPFVTGNDTGVEDESDPRIMAVTDKYAGIGDGLPVRYIYYFLGPVLLIMLFMAVAGIGDGGLARAFMVLPPMAYNFGTMLLLSGTDSRFFHFNHVILIPLLFIFMQRGGAEDREA